MVLVIDASVAIKWVLQENGTAEAMTLLSGETLIAPDLLLVECANTLVMAVRRGRLSEIESRDGLAIIARAPVRFSPSAPNIARSHALAIETRQTAYDCLYLALAISERATMISADQRFLDGMRTFPHYARNVRALSP